jgi:hypothetical protein
VTEHHYHYHLNHNLFCRHAPGIRPWLVEYTHQTLVVFLVEKHDSKGVPFSSKEDQDLCFDLLDNLVDILSRTEYPDKIKTGRFWPWLFDLCQVFLLLLFSLTF